MIIKTNKSNSNGLLKIKQNKSNLQKSSPQNTSKPSIQISPFSYPNIGDDPSLINNRNHELGSPLPLANLIKENDRGCLFLFIYLLRITASSWC